MSFWTAVVIIAAIVMIGQLIRSRTNARIGYATDKDGNPVGNPQREAELQEEVEQLRERVKVLERIATDPAKRTAEEIEKLRDD